jgi:hypothetical protein
MSKFIDGNKFSTQHGDLSALPHGLREANSAELENVAGGFSFGDILDTIDTVATLLSPPVAEARLVLSIPRG